MWFTSYLPCVSRLDCVSICKLSTPDSSLSIPKEEIEKVLKNLLALADYYDKIAMEPKSGEITKNFNRGKATGLDIAYSQLNDLLLKYE